MLTKTGRWDDPKYVIDFLHGHDFVDARAELFDFDWDVDDVDVWVDNVGAMLGGFIHAGWDTNQCSKYGDALQAATKEVMVGQLGAKQNVRFSMTAVVAVGRKVV